MSAHAHVGGVPDSWVREFPVDPFVDGQQGEDWFRLYDVVFNHPIAAIRLFERFADEQTRGSDRPPSFAALRMFLTAHGDQHREELAALSRKSPFFAKAYQTAQDLGPITINLGFRFFKRG